MPASLANATAVPMRSCTARANFFLARNSFTAALGGQALAAAHPAIESAAAAAAIYKHRFLILPCLNDLEVILVLVPMLLLENENETTGPLSRILGIYDVPKPA